MAATVRLVGGPAPYREALRSQLDGRGVVVSDDGESLVICCTTEEHWREAADSALWQPTVVVVPELALEGYVRALALGAGAVHLDTPTSVIADVLRAAVEGEALLPLAVTQALASHHPPTSEQIDGAPLVGIEVEIAVALREGKKASQIARDLNYSERTIRRKLQGIYLKLGVRDRETAIDTLRSRP